MRDLTKSPAIRRPLSRFRLGGVCVAAGVLSLVFASSAGATLQLAEPAFQGRVDFSSDGLGQTSSGGTLQAQVPAGSTVVRAYLYGTYYGGSPSLASRTIDFDGTSVVTQVTPTQSGAFSNLLFTTRANVTSQVATKVGSGGAAPFNFVVGNDPSDLDGLALVVVYSNPALGQGTVAILDGGASPAGDTATFNFASPIDPGAPGFTATMAVGVGFSFQGSGHNCVKSQFSTINVNSQSLTTCAGGSDDGTSFDGGLITVGGVGDSFDNPTPPANPPTDDELYNLVPFLSQGDTQLSIVTANPSADDNLFLAAIRVTAQAAVTTEDCDNGRDDDGDGQIDGADPDCAPPPQDGGGGGFVQFPREGPAGDPTCRDGFDNDIDGQIDGADSGCKAAGPSGPSGPTNPGGGNAGGGNAGGGDPQPGTPGLDARGLFSRSFLGSVASAKCLAGPCLQPGGAAVAAAARRSVYRVAVRGRFRGRPCGGRVRLTYRVGGREPVSRRARVNRRTCRYRKNVRLHVPGSTRLPTVLRIAQRFSGTTKIRGGRGKTLRVTLRRAR